jgi:hypothetical protein
VQEQVVRRSPDDRGQVGGDLDSLAPDAMAGGTGLEKNGMPFVWPPAECDGHLKSGERRLPIRCGQRCLIDDPERPRPELGVFLSSQLLEPIGIDLGRRQRPRFQGAQQVLEPVAAAEQQLGRLAANGGAHRLPVRYNRPAHGRIVHLAQGLQRRELDRNRLAGVEQFRQYLERPASADDPQQRDGGKPAIGGRA